MANNDDGGSFVTGFFFGGIIGIVVGILLAPKPGSETRTAILEQSDVLRDKAEELAARVREQAGPAVDTVRQRMGPALEGVREKVGPMVERVSSAVRPDEVSPTLEPEEPIDVAVVGQETKSRKTKA